MAGRGQYKAVSKAVSHQLSTGRVTRRTRGLAPRELAAYPVLDGSVRRHAPAHVLRESLPAQQAQLAAQEGETR